MALTLDRYARVDVTQIADVLYCANGVDNAFMTDALETSRFEGTISTTAPDDSSMTVTEGAAGSVFPDAATYTYYIAYVRDSTVTVPQMISGASAGISELLTAAKADIDLASIPVSADAQVTDRWIYRKGDTITIPRFLVALGDNTTTTYEDTTPDSTLLANDVIREAIGAFPKKRPLASALPPKFQYLEAWDGKLWGAKDGIVYWSEPQPNHEDFPGTNSIKITITKGVSEKVTGMRVHLDWLYVWTEDAVFQLSGTGITNIRADLALSRAGTPTGHTVISVGGDLYWLNRQVGPVMWPGQGVVTKIGVVIEDFWGRVDKDRLRMASVIYDERRHEIVWYVTEGRTDRNNRRIVYDLISNQFQIDHGMDAYSVGLIRNEIGDKYPLEGTLFGDVFQYDVGDSDGATDATATGTPTTADGITLADTGATFGSAADIEGASIVLLDTDGNLLQVNRVLTRSSSTSLRLALPIPAGVTTYHLGGFYVSRETPWLQADAEGPCILNRIMVEYEYSANATSISVDYKIDNSSVWTNIASFTNDGDGRVEIVEFVRGENFKLRFRWATAAEDVKILGYTLKFTPTRGF